MHLNKGELFVVRPMELKDIDQAVNVHMKAFNGYMNASLGRNYVKHFLMWFINSPLATAWVAEDSNKIIGYLVGAKLGYDSELNRSLLLVGVKAILTHPFILFHPHFLRTVKMRLKLLFNKPIKTKEIFKEPDGVGISLVGIASYSDKSIKGVGKGLMTAFQNFAQSNGYAFTRLSVYEENTRARSLYEKTGWQCLNRNQNVLYYYNIH